MSEWTSLDFEARRAAHRRGHSKPMHDRAALDRSYDATASSIVSISATQFVSDGVLTDANIDDAIDAAIAKAIELTGPSLEGAGFEVTVPAGKWTLSRSHAFPSFEQYRCMVGFRGAGMNETVFLVNSDSTGSRVFTFGSAASTEVPFTMYLRVSGFSVIATTQDNCNRSAIRIYACVNPIVSDVRVRGLTGANNTYDQGRGLEILPALEDDVEVNSQFVVVRDCDFSINMTGVYARVSYPVLLDNCHAQGNHFEDAIFEGVLGEWINSGAQFQGNAGVHLDRWYGGRKMPGIVTGFSRTTGLDSGTGATCGAAASNLCLVTGLSGLELLADRGRWLELTPAGTTANELKVRGVYKIDSVVDATSCYIRKGSNHTEQDSLTWQVREAQAGSDMVFDNLYDEGVDRAMFGFWRDNFGNGCYTVRRPLALGQDFIVESDGVQKVRLEDPIKSNVADKLARIWLTIESHVDGLPSEIEVDDYSYPGHSSQSQWQNQIAGRTPYAYRDSGGGSQVRLRSALQEMGFVEIWDSRVTSSMTLNGTDIEAMVGLLNGSPCAPWTGSNYPTYEDADTGFGGPCVVNVAPDAAFNATIDADHLPDVPFLCTIVVVARLESTTPLAADPRRVQVTTDDAQQFIAFNDAVWTSGNYVMTEGASIGGNSLSTMPQAVDTDPHVYIFGRYPAGANVYSTDHGEDYDNSNAATLLTATHTVGQDLSITIGGGGGAINAFRWALFAVKAGPLSQAEHRKIVDLARNEWPLSEA